MEVSNITYITVDVNSRVPKYRQIVDAVTSAIEKGKMRMGDKIPSINEVSEHCLLSRDTVEKAYSKLKALQIIESVKGKGYYITKTDLHSKKRILFLINKLSPYKMKIFNSFSTVLGTNATVDLDLYHCDPTLFVSILSQKENQYDHLVIMPHFKDVQEEYSEAPTSVMEILNRFDPEKLLVLDRNLPNLAKAVGRIYQDFDEDIFSALTAGMSKVKKYRKLVLVYPNKGIYPYPKGIVAGFRKFCLIHEFDFEVLDEIYEGMELQSHDLYIVIAETDLVLLVKQVRDQDYVLGTDMGIISYNDTPLKELLGITVISTDFEKMGTTAAQMLLENKPSIQKNDFNFIDRDSV